MVRVSSEVCAIRPSVHHRSLTYPTPACYKYNVQVYLESEHFCCIHINLQGDMVKDRIRTRFPHRRRTHIHPHTHIHINVHTSPQHTHRPHSTRLQVAQGISLIRQAAILVPNHSWAGGNSIQKSAFSSIERYHHANSGALVSLSCRI